jgi:hypothetical protein
MQGKTLAFLSPLLLLLSGCTFTQDGESPACLAVPRARAGDSYLYDIVGLPMSMTIKPIGMWNAGDGLPLLPKGSTLQISIAANPLERLAYNGSFVPAYQAAYQLTHPTKGKMDYWDDWIALDGSTIQMSTRRINVGDEGVRHLIDLSNVDKPSLLMAPIFWQLGLGDGSASGAARMGLPGNPLPWSMAWTRERIVVEGGRCVTTVDLNYSDDTYPGPPDQAQMIFDSAISLPVEVLAKRGPSSMELRLRAHRQGAGPEIGSPPLTDLAGTRLALRPPVHGAPDGAPVFPMPYAEAWQAMMEDERVQAWIQGHPDHLVAEVAHLLGAPEGPYRDGWLVHFLSGNHQMRVKAAWRHSLLPDLPVGLPGKGPIEVLVCEETCRIPPYRPANQGLAWPTLDALAAIHARVYGKPAEVLYCRGYSLEVDQPTLCGLGTHAGTWEPYIDGGGGFVAPGILVWPEKGWIMQESSWDDSALGPLLQHPPMAPITPHSP